MTIFIAHRGYSARAPENTLPAIQKAIDCQVDCVEVDIRLSKDGIPIVIHDDTLFRTTDGKKTDKVAELTLAQLKNLDAGSWFHRSFLGTRIPTLKELLELNWGSTRLMLELKAEESSPQQLVKETLNTIKKHVSFSRKYSPFFGSFEPLVIQELKKQVPLQSIIGIAEDHKTVESHLKMGLNCLALDYSLLTVEQVTKWHQQEIMIWAFTVNDPVVARSLVHSNIPGIITDDPEMLSLFVKNTKCQCFH